MEVRQMLCCTVKPNCSFDWLSKHHAAVPVGHDKVYIIGGGYPRKARSPDARIDVCVFNTVYLRWTTLTTTRGEERPPEVPSGRYGHTAVLVGDTAVYVWGGESARPMCNALYAFDVDTHGWRRLADEVSGFVPEARWGHSACVLGKDMYVHGGMNQLEVFTNDMYKLDTTTMVWSLIHARGIPPPGSSGHTATIMGTKMFVFGGRRGGDVLSDPMRVFDTETNRWLSVPYAQLRPGERTSHSAFAYNGELYIFGGEWHDGGARRRWSAARPCNDMWKFSPETFSWKRVEPKVNGLFLVSDGCCCMVGDRVVIFGGYRGNTRDDYELFVLDLGPISLKTLCKLVVLHYGLERSGLPHNVRWELAAFSVPAPAPPVPYWLPVTASTE